MNQNYNNSLKKFEIRTEKPTKIHLLNLVSEFTPFKKRKSFAFLYICLKNKNQTIKFMKKIKNTLILSILSVSVFAQDTLQHFSLDIVTPITESYLSNQGYYTGHNSYGDEEFAKKI